jgi:hypothetical protein
VAAQFPQKDLRGHRRSNEGTMPAFSARHLIGLSLFLLPAIGFSSYTITPDAVVAYCAFK